MSETGDSKKKYNYGIALLKAFMCLEVIIIHCWRSGCEGILWTAFGILKPYAAPSFMLISFFLMHDFFIKNDKKIIIGRIEKLILPQVFYAILYFIVYKILYILFNSDTDVKLSDLLIQIVTGHSEKLNPTMWFQTDLIVLTVLFLLINFFFRKKYSLVLVGMLIVSYFFQYSGLYLYFSHMNESFSYPLGRTVEMLPLAVIGFEIADINVTDKINDNRWIKIFLLALGIIFFIRNEIFTLVDGYGYSGIQISVLTLLIVLLAMIIPLEKLPGVFRKCIEVITKYTLGIYCMHRMISRVLDTVVARNNLNIETHSLLSCVLIYVLCYLISALGAQIFRNTKINGCIF